MGDLPDYTREMVLTGTAGFTGLEELAARLGSIVPWDVKGNIILMEDFESELTEWTDDSDVGCSATRSSRHKYSGDWAVKLYQPAGLAAGTPSLYRYFHFPGTTKYAAFARFYWDAGGKTSWLWVKLRNGTTEFYIEVDFYYLTSTLSVITTGGAYYDITAAVGLLPPGNAWFPVLVTFDLESGYYNKLYVGDTEYDISSVALYSTPLVSYPSGSIGVQANTVSEGSTTTYVDDIIIAKNVP